MVNVAQIINTRGLKGECKVYLKTDSVNERFAKNNILYLEDGTPMKVLRFSRQGNLGYVFFEGIDSIEKAEKLKQKMLVLPDESLPPLEDGEYYYHQLIGCRVFNEKGEDLGTVSEVLETGANLVLRVKGKENSFLLPFVDAHVQDVNPQAKTITITEMEGLR